MTFNIYDAMQMRKEGKTYAEIGAHFGVSRQAVHSRLSDSGAEATKRPVTLTGIDPAFAEIMAKYGITVSAMAKQLSWTRGKLMYRLQGHRDWSYSEKSEVKFGLGMLGVPSDETNNLFKNT